MKIKKRRQRISSRLRRTTTRVAETQLFLRTSTDCEDNNGDGLQLKASSKSMCVPNYIRRRELGQAFNSINTNSNGIPLKPPAFSFLPKGETEATFKKRTNDCAESLIELPPFSFFSTPETEARCHNGINDCAETLIELPPFSFFSNGESETKLEYTTNNNDEQSAITTADSGFFPSQEAKPEYGINSHEATVAPKPTFCNATTQTEVDNRNCRCKKIDEMRTTFTTTHTENGIDYRVKCRVKTLSVIQKLIYSGPVTETEFDATSDSEEMLAWKDIDLMEFSASEAKTDGKYTKGNNDREEMATTKLSNSTKVTETECDASNFGEDLQEQELGFSSKETENANNQALNDSDDTNITNSNATETDRDSKYDSGIFYPEEKDRDQDTTAECNGTKLSNTPVYDFSGEGFGSNYSEDYLMPENTRSNSSKDAKWKYIHSFHNVVGTGRPLRSLTVTNTNSTHCNGIDNRGTKTETKLDAGIDNWKSAILKLPPMPPFSFFL